ncbi:helix-turn-helix transcriptional regulator [Idiomarina aminovorans]|uniref:helix-turn-helix transcriptional regulator n=1 Tax=Idiomarina aminovorans TaxID=2914829 RepID=UPI002006120B|nr:helix-turn-helix domain-containing protein [Idiomarina sp. ATCH4]MCK7458462.1 helix-turn-helix domain-containing protein [Idiomarina sp. ATCH4]
MMQQTVQDNRDIEVMTVKEVCNLLRISRSTFCRVTQNHDRFPEPIPGTGKRFLYPAKEVRKFAGLQ